MQLQPTALPVLRVSEGATSKNTLRVCHSQRFRASEELDAIAYFLDVLPVLHATIIKVKYRGDLIVVVILNYDFERGRNREPLADASNVHLVLLQCRTNQKIQDLAFSLSDLSFPSALIGNPVFKTKRQIQKQKD